jgi:hypothetical protein
MDALELVRLAVSTVGIVVAAAGLYAKRGDIADYALRRAKAKVLRRATAEARLVPSASTIVEVFVPLHSRGERRGAEDLELEGHARLHENGCWVTIDRTPAVFRHAMRGAQW